MTSTSTDTPHPRQRARVAFHLTNDYGVSFAPTLDVVADLPRPIAVVEVLDGLQLQTDDAQVFRSLADVLLAGAALLDTHRDRAAAPRLREPDTHTSTVDGDAAHARRLGEDEDHPLTCRCTPCARDLADL